MMFLQGKRWFIWTLVVLLVAGVALVTYISFSDTAQSDTGTTLIHRPVETKDTK